MVEITVKMSPFKDQNIANKTMQNSINQSNIHVHSVQSPDRPKETSILNSQYQSYNTNNTNNNNNVKIETVQQD